MTISQFTNELLDKVLNELKKKENMNKIENNLVEPLIRYTFKRLYPYILISSSIFITTFLVALIILLLILRNSNIFNKS
tara:strand:+ start:695 stop:931 length:237 start_codon:yes stop_codon:yes gene_type:complete